MILIDNVKYIISPSIRSGATVVGVKEDEESIEIPSHINYEGKKYVVSGIVKLALISLHKCKRITFPDTIRSILDNNFSTHRWYQQEMKHLQLDESDVRNKKLLFDTITIASKSLKDLCESFSNLILNRLKVSAPRKLLINNEELRIVNIADDVKYIAPYAFYNCIDIKAINISNSVTEIFKYAFGECKSLTSIVLPRNITSLEDGLFINCSQLQNIIIPNSVQYINKDVFRGCHSLTSILIPEEVSSLYISAFNGCSSLKTIVVDEKNQNYDSRENSNAIIRTKDNSLCVACSKTIIPSDITKIAVGAFINSPAELYIPKGIKNLDWMNLPIESTMKSIVVDNENLKYDSRNNCNAIVDKETHTLVFACSNTIIPNDVVSIGRYAFRNCKTLKSIIIPNSVISIGYCAFCFCSSLTSITIPNSVISIGKYAFYLCKLLTMLDYAGTREQWKKIDKSEGWNCDSNIKIICCTDGEIKL